MSRSKIQWTDRAWNPVRGCSRVSEGCRNCYAERHAARFSGLGEPFENFADRPTSKIDLIIAEKFGETPRHAKWGWTGRVELIEDKLLEPLGWRKPTRVFVNSMSDLFHEALPDGAIDRVFAVMALAPRHTFQVLTKRPERMRAYFQDPETSYRVAAEVCKLAVGFRPWKGMCDWRESDPWPLPNVWLGVSVEDQATAEERIPILLDTPAAVRFVSYEPALEAVNFASLKVGADRICSLSGWRWTPTGDVRVQRLDWIIVGGESGPGARPCDVAWIRSVVGQCKAAGVACFTKQLGAHVRGLVTDAQLFQPPYEIIHDKLRDGVPLGCRFVLRDRKGGDPSEWPTDLRVREFPREPAP